MIDRKSFLKRLGLGCLMAPLLKDGDPTVERASEPVAETVGMPFVQTPGPEVESVMTTGATTGAVYTNVELIYINGQGGEVRLPVDDFEVTSPMRMAAERLPDGVEPWSLTVDLLP